ncbi:MAG: glycosyltransferase [Geminicoccaceae bacterium]
MNERFAAVVAIPVRDEAERIGVCLDALAAQRDDDGRSLQPGSFEVVLLLNNCTDDTARAVQRLRARLPFRLSVIERELPAAMAHAGWARKLAMDAAAELVADSGRPGVILTTDADGRVGRRWLAANLAAVAGGADLVAGYVRADRAEHAQLPASILRRGRLESRYEWLLAELQARLDFEPHDPWPRHRIASGASLAVTHAAYRQAGGLSPIPTGEDRALAEQVTNSGGRVRHSLAAQVAVSCRLDGRAAGGMAATIRQRALIPELACDPALEPALELRQRALWRGALRRLHRQVLAQPLERWAALLHLSPAAVGRAMGLEHFGAAWAVLEQASPILAYRPLSPRELPGQIAVAEWLLADLRGRYLLPDTLQHVDAIELGPVLVHDPRARRRGVDEQLRSLVAGERVVGFPGPMHQHYVTAGLDGLHGEGGHALEVDDAPVVDDLG